MFTKNRKFKIIILFATKKHKIFLHHCDAKLSLLIIITREYFIIHEIRSLTIISPIPIYLPVQLYFNV